MFVYPTYFHFTTYSYANLNGAGNPNVHQNIPSTLHKQWHYIYYGYSRIQRKAYGYIKFLEGEGEITHANCNHYVTNQHYFTMEKDKFYPTLQSEVAYVNINYGKGAF